MNKKIILLIIISCIFLVVLAVKIFLFDQVRTWNAASTDIFFTLRYWLRGREVISNNVCVFNIDDQDISRFHITLNNRDIFSEIIKTLADFHVKTIVFDIIFEHSHSLESDRELVTYTEKAGIVLFPVKKIPQHNGNPEIEPEDTMQQKYMWYPHITVPGNPEVIREFSTPFAELVKAARGLGVINFSPDPDGITRKVPLVFTSENGYLFSLVLIAIIHYFDINPNDITVSFGKEIKLDNARLPDGTVRDFFIPIDKQGKMLVNYAAPYKDTLEFYPVRDLINFRDNPEEYSRFREIMTDTLVVVTETSSVSVNNVATVFDPVVAHNEVLVNAINTILMENFIYEPSELDIFSILISVLLFSLLIVLIVWFNFARFITFAFTTFICCLAGSFLLFMYADVLCIIFPDLVGFIISVFIIIFYELVISRLERTRYKSEYEKMKITVANSRKKDTKSEIDVDVCREFYVTDSQKEILLLMHQDYTYKKIAALLKISEGTVKTQVSRIKQQTGIHDKNKLLKKFFHS